MPSSHRELMVELTELWAPNSYYSVLSGLACAFSLENAVVTAKARKKGGGEKGWTEPSFEEQDSHATNICGTSPVVQWLRLCLPKQGVGLYP